MTTKVCTTHDLLLLAKAGRDEQLNRQLNYELVKGMVDDKKVCVLSILLYGHNMDDTSRPLHHRVQGLIPVKELRNRSKLSSTFLTSTLTN